MSQSHVVSVESQPIKQQPNYLEPLLRPFLNPIVLSSLAVLILLLILKNSQRNEPVLAKARFATANEIRNGERRGLKQIAEKLPDKAAFKLENLVLSDIQPAIALVGKSGCGKTRSICDPAIKNGIDQGWTNFVFDVKGEFISKHAAYALSKGYEVYIYAPGFAYSDGLNFLNFMKDENDAKTAEEIARILEANFGKPGERKDGFFSPQGVALLRLVFMMAKASPFGDLLSAWKFLSLPDLAKRLKAAHNYDHFESLGFSIWIKEAASALRSMAGSEQTVEGIVGTAMTNFQRMVDPSIVPCLMNHTIPLDLTGKQIVFFQLDEDAKSATAPLVATAIHMLVTRNLNAKVKRTKPLGLFLDEFDSIALPDVKDYITKMRSYGLAAILSYQSDSQVVHRYSRAYADSILSSCGIKIYFNTGHSETAQKLSNSLGNKQVNYQTESRSYGGKTTRNISEHIQQVPLITAREINEQEQGEAVIAYAPGFKYHPHKTKIKLEPKNDILWKKECHEIWFSEIKPYRKSKIKAITGDINTALIDREVLSEAMIPSSEEQKIMQNCKILETATN